jgi:hypothetical protein
VFCNQPTCMFRLFFSSLILPKHSRHVVSLQTCTREADQAPSCEKLKIIQSRLTHHFAELNLRAPNILTLTMFIALVSRRINQHRCKMKHC